MKNKFTKGEVSKIMITICIFYLSLSSYSIGYDNYLIGTAALVFLSGTYVWVFFLILYNSIKSIALLNAHINFIVINDEALEKSLRLKRWIMLDFLGVSLVYLIVNFSYMIVFHVV